MKEVVMVRDTIPAFAWKDWKTSGQPVSYLWLGLSTYWVQVTALLLDQPVWFHTVQKLLYHIYGSFFAVEVCELWSAFIQFAHKNVTWNKTDVERPYSYNDNNRKYHIHWIILLEHVFATAFYVCSFLMHIAMLLLPYISVSISVVFWIKTTVNWSSFYMCSRLCMLCRLLSPTSFP
jgi:hypothetical protein